MSFVLPTRQEGPCGRKCLGRAIDLDDCGLSLSRCVSRYALSNVSTVATPADARSSLRILSDRMGEERVAPRLTRRASSRPLPRECGVCWFAYFFHSLI